MENFELGARARHAASTCSTARTGELVARFDAPPGFCFHHVNAYDDGDDVVVDVCVYEDPSIVEALYMDRIQRAASAGARRRG